MKIPYQLVSMAAILRDYLDDNDLQYKNSEHEDITSIADYLYNVGGSPEELKANFKKIYDSYGPDYFAKVIKDMEAIDGQLTSDDKVQELVDDYFDRLDTDVTASTKVTATDYNPHLIKVSPKDKKYILDNLNRSSKTLDEFDNNYYKFEFVPGYSGLWSSDAGLDILDESGIEYELVQKNIDSATNVTASYSEDYYDFDDFVMDLGDRLAEQKISRADADREIKKFCQDHRTCDYRTLHNIVYENATGKVDAENDRLRKQIKDMKLTSKDLKNKSVKASDNPFYDKLSDKDKRFVKNTEKRMATAFSPNTFDVYNALLPYIGEYSSSTGWVGSCDLMKVEDDNTADGYRYNVIWDDDHDIDVFSWQINTNSRVGGDFTLMILPAHGMPIFCDSENDFYRAIRKVFGNGLKKIDN